MPLGAAELAARTGAVLAPAYCRRTPDGYDIVFEDPIEVVDTGRRKLDAIETSKAMIRYMESWIASDAGQWMVLERIWKEPRPRRADHAKPTLGARTVSPGEP